MVLAGQEVWRPRLTERRVVTFLGGVGAFGLAWGPWLLLNYREVGFIFGTAPVQVLGVSLGWLAPEMAWYLDRPGLTPYDLATEGAALLTTIGGFRPDQPALGVLSVPVLVVGVVGGVRLARTRSSLVALGAAVVVAAAWSVYQPAFTVVRMAWAEHVGRFLVPIVLVVLLLSLAAYGRRRSLVGVLEWYLWIAGGIHMVSVVDGLGFPVLRLAVGLTAVSLCLVVMCSLGKARGRWAAAFAISLVVAGVPLLSSWKQSHRFELLAENYALHEIERMWLPAVAQAEAVEPLRIAFTNGPWQSQDQQFLYPFLGGRLQNRLLFVPASLDGAITPHAGPDPRSEAKSFERWVDRLLSRSITHVLSFPPATVELEWMERGDGRFKRLEGDGSRWGFYELVP